jgi:hypothetical protein
MPTGSHCVSEEGYQLLAVDVGLSAASDSLPLGQCVRHRGPPVFVDVPLDPVPVQQSQQLLEGRVVQL